MASTSSLPVPILNLLRRYLLGWRKYADFSSQTSWPEYLSFFAVNLGTGLALRGLESLTGDGFFGLVGLLYGFAVLIPGVAITVRFIRSFLSPRPPQGGGSPPPTISN